MIKRARYKKQGDLRYVQAGLKSSLSGIGFAATTQFGVWRDDSADTYKDVKNSVSRCKVSKLEL